MGPGYEKFIVVYNNHIIIYRVYTHTHTHTHKPEVIYMVNVQ
jgi:hypothetical protein